MAKRAILRTVLMSLAVSLSVLRIIGGDPIGTLVSSPSPSTEVSGDPAPRPTQIPLVDSGAEILVANVSELDAAVAAANAAATRPYRVNVRGRLPINASRVIPRNVVLDVNDGALAVSAGTLTIRGRLLAGPRQIFEISGSGALDISGAQAETYYFEWYGITSGVDNAIAMQRLIDSRRRVSTKIQLVPGTIYSYASPISFDATQGMAIVGNESGYNTILSELRYTGGGSDPANTFRSAVGFTAIGVKFSYSSPEFKGDLVRSGHSDGTDTTGFVFDRCFFGSTTGLYNAATLLSLDLAIIGKVENCTFQGALKGIRGRTTRYSNVITVDNCTFMDVGVHIYNTGENWIVRGCTHEATQHAMAGGIRIGEVRALDGDSTSWNLVYEGNWLGDAKPGSSNYSAVTLNTAYGAAVIGNKFALPNERKGGLVTAITMKDCYGVSILGNYIAAGRFIEYASAASHNILIAGNKTDNTLQIVPEYSVPATSEVFLDAAGNTVSGAVNFGGGAYGTADPSNYHSLLIGVANAAVDLNNGAAIRTANNIAGVPEGSLIYQPRAKAGQTPGWHIFQTLSGRPLVLGDDRAIFSVPVTIGGGSPITKIIKGTLSIDPAPIEPGGVSSQRFQLPGAVVGDSVVLNPPATGLTPGLLVMQVYVSGPNSVTVVFQNTNRGRIDEAPGNWTFRLER